MKQHDLQAENKKFSTENLQPQYFYESLLLTEFKWIILTLIRLMQKSMWFSLKTQSEL